MSAPGLASVLGDPTGIPAWIAFAAAVLALVPAGLRWLRVAQREHYLPGATGRFAARWWLAEPVNMVAAVVGLGGLALSAPWPLFAVLPAAVMATTPRHLSVRGRTSPLVFTRRLRSLGAVWAVLQLAILSVGVVVGAPAVVAAAGVLLVPLMVDGACAVTAPVERLLGERFVTAATQRLAQVSPTVVGITGSYGKTSTKHHVAHLLVGTRRAVVTPASFNNRAGLARAINENLSEGTEVFVAEMGTYGPGEIADLCRWCPPTIAVITAIGPVHLERFGSEDRIAAAKEEITRGAEVVVLNVDDARLAGLADRLAAAGTRVIRCSARDEGADVAVRATGDALVLWLGGRPSARQLPRHPGLQPSNLACAVAVASELGVTEAELGERIADMPTVANRLASGRAPSGVTVVDDTFNANPAGARAALATLARLAGSGRRVVVTPGMVELGRRQAEENRRFGEESAAVATDMVVVGLTNRRALLRGASSLHPTVVRTRDEAVHWVRTTLGPGDVVLYENDLPDHYP